MKILITGGNSFTGIPLTAKLKEAGHEVTALSSKDYDLTEQSEVRKLFKEHSPDAIYHLAGKIGGIMANKTYPADFLYQNLAMNTYFLEEARKAGIKRLLYTFCGCSLPEKTKNPIIEESLWTGMPAPESMFYSIAKSTSHLQIVAYRRQYGLDWASIIPANAYGKNDNFHKNDSHVVAGLIRRFHDAKMNYDKSVTCWGTGLPLRDFINIDDVATALVIALDKHHTEIPINIASGKAVSIKELTEIVKDVVGFEGEIVWDSHMPTGQQVKIFDNERMKSILGFEPVISLENGIRDTYDWYLKALQTGQVRL